VVSQSGLGVPSNPGWVGDRTRKSPWGAEKLREGCDRPRAGAAME